PEERLHELARVLTGREPVQDFEQTLRDYTLLLDQLFERWGEGPPRPLPAGLDSDDLTDWILSMEGERDGSHAWTIWKRTKSLPWVGAALMHATGQDAGLSELLEAAAGIPRTSPAFPAVVFHRARLLRETGREDEARALIDRVLEEDGPRWPASTVNLFRSL